MNISEISPLKIEAVGTFTPPPEPPTVADGDTDKEGDD